MKKLFIFAALLLGTTLHAESLDLYVLKYEAQIQAVEATSERDTYLVRTSRTRFVCQSKNDDARFGYALSKCKPLLSASGLEVYRNAYIAAAQKVVSDLFEKSNCVVALDAVDGWIDEKLITSIMSERYALMEFPDIERTDILESQIFDKLALTVDEAAKTITFTGKGCN